MSLLIEPKRAPIIGYDSVSADKIPQDANVAAGYIDGFWKWTTAMWDRFPEQTCQKVSITVGGNLWADVADVENGDMTPADANTWILSKQAQHIYPCVVYCNRETLPAVWGACKGREYYVWVADWTNKAHTVDDTAACQYENNAQKNYDLTLWYNQNLLNQLCVRPWRWG